MGSSPKTDTSPGNAAPLPGSKPPPAAPPFQSAGFPGDPFYQAYAGQPFNENNEVYASFLPEDPTSSATGLNRDMLNAIMGISAAGEGRVARGAADAGAAAAKPSGKQYNLMMPPKLYGASANYAANLIDQYNKTDKTDPVAYMNAREELARIASIGTAKRYNDRGGGGGGSSHGGGNA